MTRPTWQRRTGPSPKIARVIQAGADMHTALAMLSRGAVASTDGAWTRLTAANGATARLPTAIVETALAEIAAGDVVTA